jgi:hypothetical protein
MIHSLLHPIVIRHNPREVSMTSSGVVNLLINTGSNADITMHILSHVDLDCLIPLSCVSKYLRACLLTHAKNDSMAVKMTLRVLNIRHSDAGDLRLMDNAAVVSLARSRGIFPIVIEYRPTREEQIRFFDFVTTPAHYTLTYGVSSTSNEYRHCPRPVIIRMRPFPTPVFDCFQNDPLSIQRKPALVEHIETICSLSSSSGPPALSA